ncbi:O-antigen/teichoic acid export membrane protein [Microbacterium trichothecenolyticum]|uniref:oligosaccharide flippase family protein n=1 Tax=Microbacterium trichothecenolyticum TaxID=69370 RepID=UPI00285D1784|nr:oligosaccharide flippase family protein [Microbacterium trichothecenolyticum]MDR7185332.1 O-antigen/teichoic acid export membrane protein [Microbacterium trichothecenolyticum]
MLSTFIYQVVSARYLAPADFGLLAAFFVIVNTAAIGSSSLQNAIVVKTAEELAYGPTTPGRRRSWPVEAVLIGCGGGLAVALAAPWLATQLDTSAGVVLAAATTIPLGFLLADAVGRLQGSGKVVAAVWTSTAVQVARVLFLLAAMVVGFGLAGAIGAVVASTIVVLIGALLAARHSRRPVGRVLGISGVSIVVLTTAFAWLTNADVIYVRAGTPEDIAGAYASAAVLVKVGMLIPSTLSLYLLPRFVRNRHDPRLRKVGTAVVLAISLATSLAMAAFFALFGPQVVNLLFGSDYVTASQILVPLTFAYLPWVASQGMLISLTSSASRVGAVVLVLATIVQFIAFPMVLPDLGALMTAIGAMGAFVFASFLTIDVVAMRRKSDRRPADVA